MTKNAKSGPVPNLAYIQKENLMKKRKIIIPLIIILLISLIPLPYPLSQSIVANHINNATNNKEKISVIIEGTYYKSLLFNDRFVGTLDVEGIENVKKEVSMSLLQDKETNMNLLSTNEPINRIVQQDRFMEFIICIPDVLEDGTAIWNDSHGTTITTFDSMSDALKFLADLE